MVETEEKDKLHFGFTVPDQVSECCTIVVKFRHIERLLFGWGVFCHDQMFKSLCFSEMRRMLFRDDGLVLMYHF